MAPELYTTINEAELGGFAPLNRRDPAALASAASLWADLLEGKVPSYLLQEALSPRTPAIVRAIEASYPHLIRVRETMTTSDFPSLTSNVLSRMLLGRFRAYPSAWRSFVRVVQNLRDFRPVTRILPAGMDDPWDAIPEQTEITYGAMSESPVSYTPVKYARGAKVSFEALMNDDIGLFDEIPNLLGTGGARTLSRAVTNMYVAVNGPHASVYTAGNGNIITGNPDLDAAALSAALGQLRQQTDANGEPVMVEAAVLVVPPALEMVARAILSATELRYTPAGALDPVITTGNYLSGSVTLAVDPYIPIVASTANGNTSWFLFANPSGGLPAMEVGFIQGFAEPQLYQKIADTARINGGIDQMAGDFLTMSQQWKGVMAFGGGVVNPTSTVASNGTSV